MNFRNFRAVLVFFFVMIPAMAVLNVSQLYAAHGCATNDPDRDKDGVPDKDDKFPDDPTRSKDELLCDNKQTPLMKLYFIPFQTATLESVKIKNIELQSEIAYWVYENLKVVEDFKEIFRRAKKMPSDNFKKFNNKRVRLKIHFPQEETVYYVDNGGFILRNKALYKFTDQQMEELEVKIKSLIAIVDLNIKLDWKDHLRRA